ncbi:MAG: hypothetical protein RIC82_03715 [Parvibaculum sp.]
MMSKKPSKPAQSALEAMKKAGINYQMGKGSRPEKPKPTGKRRP